MDTAVKFPNGTVTYPREKIPAHTILSEDLAYRLRFREVSENTEAILKNVSFPSKHDGDTNQTAEAVGGGDDNGGDSAESDPKKANEGLSLSLVRALCFLAMDYNSFRMLTSDDATSSIPLKKFKAVFTKSGANPKTIYSSSRSSIKSRLNPTQGQVTALSTEIIDQIIANSSDNSLF